MPGGKFATPNPPPISGGGAMAAQVAELTRLK
jgi:hypothetical protein